MEKITINGLEFYDFGENEYTFGMHLISCTNPPKDLVKRVLSGEFFGVFLNPSARCTDFEFYGVFGTPEQYRELYQHQKEAQITKIALNLFGGGVGSILSDLTRWTKCEKKANEIYRDWWKN